MLEERKEKIEKKIEEQIQILLDKDILTIEEINSLRNELYSLDNILNKEENDKKHKELMASLLNLTF